MPNNLRQVAYIAGINPKSLMRLCSWVCAARMDFYDMRVDDLSVLNRVRGLRRLAIRWNASSGTWPRCADADYKA